MSDRQEVLRVAGMLAVFVVLLGSCNNSPGSTVLITPATALLAPGEVFQFTAVASVPQTGNYLWKVNGIVGGSPSTGTITPAGVFTAPNSVTTQPILVGIQGRASQAAVSIFDQNHPSPGTVGSTQNPLVASYQIAIPLGATVQVQFGTDTSYGMSTSSIAAPTGGGTATVLVAGMRQTTTYHMQATVTQANGTQYKDADHAFTTGAIPAGISPMITTQLTGVATVSPGVELLSLTQNATQNLLCAVATDLAGNVIWYYPLPVGDYPFPIKLQPNGTMLLVIGGLANSVREIDLAGNTIFDIPLTTINAGLAEVVSYQTVGLTHDFVALPNGHLILLGSQTETVSGQPGVPAGTVVEGNNLIDWDPQVGAVWTWSTFDHLSLEHAPYGLSDWTHGNALIYSPSDGNLIFSMRNQNWVVKINYQDGKGDGSILWRLGPGGDFSLPAGQDPIEWNYGQHYPSILSPNSSGIFSLMFFNNGDNRLMNSSNDICGTTGVGACYSSVPIFELNEYTMSATVQWEDKLSPAYSICCGDAQVLPSGNVEFDVAYDVNTPNVSYIEEVTQTGTPQLIWRMNVQGQLAYRGLRIPSLYPGQVWSAVTQTNQQPAKTGEETRRPL